MKDLYDLYIRYNQIWRRSVVYLAFALVFGWTFTYIVVRTMTHGWEPNYLFSYFAWVMAALYCLSVWRQHVVDRRRQNMPFMTVYERFYWRRLWLLIALSIATASMVWGISQTENGSSERFGLASGLFLAFWFIVFIEIRRRLFLWPCELTAEGSHSDEVSRERLLHQMGDGREMMRSFNRLMCLALAGFVAMIPYIVYLTIDGRGAEAFIPALIVGLSMQVLHVMQGYGWYADR